MRRTTPIRSPPRRPLRGTRRGATYLVLLFVIAFVSAALVGGATVWSMAQQREREKQLLWAGDQYRRALRAYAAAGSGLYPLRLEELLEDSRTPAKRRFLRRLYEDPMTRRADWQLLRNERGGIVGVASRSQAAPVKVAGFATAYADFAKARNYGDWMFSAVPLSPRGTSAPGSGRPLPPGRQLPFGGPADGSRSTDLPPAEPAAQPTAAPATHPASIGSPIGNTSVPSGRALPALGAPAPQAQDESATPLSQEED